MRLSLSPEHTHTCTQTEAEAEVEAHKKESHEKKKVLGWKKKKNRKVHSKRENKKKSLECTHLRRWKVGHRLNAPATRQRLLDYSTLGEQLPPDEYILKKIHRHTSDFVCVRFFGLVVLLCNFLAIPMIRSGATPTLYY
jgi:Ni/Co efflux regulator RcnB